MNKYFGGGTLKVVERDSREILKTWQSIFYYTGLWLRYLPVKNGFNKGLGGSMHAFFTPFGIYPIMQL